MAISPTAIRLSLGILNHGIRCRHHGLLRSSNVASLNQRLLTPTTDIYRHFANNQLTPPPIPNPGSKFVKPASGIKRFLGRKLVKFIEDYTNAFEKKFPKAIKVYRVFSIGTKELLRDTMTYVRISTNLRFGMNVRNLTYKELVVYSEIPKSLVKVGPTLIVSALPAAQYFLFPLAYKFPKYLLSHHFYSIEQKVDFSLSDLTKRLHHSKPVFRHLQENVHLVNSETDPELKDKCQEVLDLLGSGFHPSNEQILRISPVFESEPFGLRYLTGSHLYSLCKLHGISSTRLLFGRRPRLWNYAGFIHELDFALDREGGPMKLNVTDLRSACFTRGLNPMNTSNEELYSFLDNWIRISQTCNDFNLSLLLHLPILLNYNNPQNWKLIYKSK